QENFSEQEQAMQEEFDTLMRVLSDRYAELCTPLEEEKKAKLEALYEQLVQCRCSLESTRALIAEAQALDPVADPLGFLAKNREREWELVTLLITFGKLTMIHCDTREFASAEFQNAMPDLSHEKSILDESRCLSVPSPPTIRPQEPSGTTSSSVLVQWTAEPDDTVDHYNVFYLAEDDFQCEDTDTVNVRQEAREDFCLIEDLEPNTFYVFWVSAVNTAGASPPSDCVTYCTVPEPPIILVEECTACMDAATIRWDSGNLTAVESYSLEHCMQAEGDVDDDTSESHITRCISGIRDCEWVVRLQPGQTYALYVRAVNSAGPSQRSDPVLIRTKG
uniref:Fibronectin type-III domain-containing protein n=1 Tax=Petromyzon marinus TaxID=7757 RepID=S4R810_PETMA